AGSPISARLMRSFQILQSFADMTALDVVTTAALTRRLMRDAIDFAAQALIPRRPWWQGTQDAAGAAHVRP
ncbi:hypothetical protein ACNJUI_21400, partial [Mycobacterium tuberculosis]